jgi:hypothetical protein
MTDWQLQTPVGLIFFNRPENTARVFEEIRRARPPKLMLAADGPRADVPGEADRCDAARQVVERVDWPCEVLHDYSDTNLGCGGRESSAFDWFFSEAEEAIFLEDDTLPHPAFFRFCEEMLDRYRDDDRIMHISGNNFQFGRRRGPADSYFFSRYPNSWGWASWRRAWRHYDVDLTEWGNSGHQDAYLGQFTDPAERRHWKHRWDKTRSGEIDTWDYQWVFALMNQGGLAINPNRNLVTNVGFGAGATNTHADMPGVSQLPLEDLKFPLKHPRRISRNVSADRHTAAVLYPDPEPPPPAPPALPLRRRIADPVLRLGGRLLEHLPEPVRPRIRDRDRRPPPADPKSG